MWNRLIKGKKNIVFLGEAGSGKRELALDLALNLARENRNVVLFDMDQTKPLFRSRDLQAALKEKGIAVHYEEQKADAPTMVGGVVPHLTDPEKRVVLDVGGGEMGARFIGGIAQFVNAENTIVFCVINPYRPWSGTLSNNDRT